MPASIPELGSLGERRLHVDVVTLPLLQAPGLLGVVGDQPAAVLALVCPQVVQTSAQVALLALEVPHQLLAPPLGLGVELLGALGRLPHQAVSLGRRVRDQGVGTGAGLVHEAVGGRLGVREDRQSRGRRLGRVAVDALGLLLVDVGGGLGRLVGSARLGRGCRRHLGALGEQPLAELVVLVVEPTQLGLDLVQELVDLLHVVALTQADGQELLVGNVLGGQGHRSPRCRGRFGRRGIAARSTGSRPGPTLSAPR